MFDEHRKDRFEKRHRGLVVVVVPLMPSILTDKMDGVRGEDEIDKHFKRRG